MRLEIWITPKRPNRKTRKKLYKGFSTGRKKHDFRDSARFKVQELQLPVEPSYKWRRKFGGGKQGGFPGVKPPTLSPLPTWEQCAPTIFRSVLWSKIAKVVRIRALACSWCSQLGRPAKRRGKKSLSPQGGESPSLLGCSVRRPPAIVPNSENL